MTLDGQNLILKSAQGNTIELAQHVFRLIEVEKLVVASTVESFALKALVPLCQHLVIYKFNCFY